MYKKPTVLTIAILSVFLLPPLLGVVADTLLPYYQSSSDIFSNIFSVPLTFLSLVSMLPLLFLNVVGIHLFAQCGYVGCMAGPTSLGALIFVLVDIPILFLLATTLSGLITNERVRKIIILIIVLVGLLEVASVGYASIPTEAKAHAKECRALEDSLLAGAVMHEMCDAQCPMVHYNPIEREDFSQDNAGYDEYEQRSMERWKEEEQADATRSSCLEACQADFEARGRQAFQEKCSRAE